MYSNDTNSPLSLIALLPWYISSEITNPEDLVEVVLDFGRKPIIRYSNDFVLLKNNVTREDINYVTSRIGPFAKDARSGIDNELHRISCIKNKYGSIIGLTCRVGRHIPGAAESIRDLLESGKSILFLGRPGVGKTTRLRSASYILSTDLRKRVVIVDSSNEIAGDGDIPHEAIGLSRRMQVSGNTDQATVMQIAVENETPEVIVIDEIGNELEAMAARTIAERGVQLIATAHGNTLEELMRNPALNDLMGGIQSVILGDAEAKRRGTQKTVLERKQPPTFDILVELLDRHTMVIHHEVCEAVDACLKGDVVPREIRKITDDGSVTVSINTDETTEKSGKSRVEKIRDRVNSNCIKVFPYGLGKENVEHAVRRMGPKFQLVHTIEEASYVLARTKMVDRHDQNLQRVQSNGATIIPIRTNNYDQILMALQKLERAN